MNKRIFLIFTSILITATPTTDAMMHMQRILLVRSTRLLQQRCLFKTQRRNIATTIVVGAAAANPITGPAVVLVSAISYIGYAIYGECVKEKKQPLEQGEQSYAQKVEEQLRKKGVPVDALQEASTHHEVREPGQPTGKDGYYPPKKWDGKRVRHPDSGQVGYPDQKGNVWVPTGTGPLAHRGPHWDVIDKSGKHRNVLPGGKVCCEQPLGKSEEPFLDRHLNGTWVHEFMKGMADDAVSHQSFTNGAFEALHDNGITHERAEGFHAPVVDIDKLERVFNESN